MMFIRHFASRGYLFIIYLFIYLLATVEEEQIK